MILLIALGVVVVIAIAVAWSESKHYWGDPGMAAFVALIIGGAISVFLCFAASWMWGTDGIREDKSYLKAISTDGSVSGSFFLASGNFGESTDYKFIKETDDGGFFMDEVGIRHAVVYELKAGERPYMVELEEFRSSPWVPWVYYGGSTYEFHVPENSIVETFKIDVND